MIQWLWRLWRKKEKRVADPDLVRAEKKIEELNERAQRIVRDNHLATDIKRALGAQ